MQIRPARLSDLPAAAQLWFDRITLLQQTEAGIKLLPDARGKWSTVAAEWTRDERVAFLAAEQDGKLIGFTVVRIAAGSPGLHPQCRGILLAMAVDLHETYRGLSDLPLDRAKGCLAAMGATQLEVDVPAHYPVEAAFWRGQGGALVSEKLRLRL